MRGQETHASCLEISRDRAERADHGVLIGGGSVPGDSERRGLGPPGRDEHLAEVDRPGLGTQDDQRALAGRNPADLGRVDDADVAGRVGGKRDARVLGHGGGSGHAGNNLERYPCLGAGCRIGGGIAEHERVAGEQPDRQLPGPGRLDQQLRVGELSGRVDTFDRPVGSRGRSHGVRNDRHIRRQLNLGKVCRYAGLLHVAEEVQLNRGVYGLDQGADSVRKLA